MQELFPFLALGIPSLLLDSLTTWALATDEITTRPPGAPFSSFACAIIVAEAMLQMHVRFEMQNAASQFAFIEEGLAYGITSPLSSQNYKQMQANSDQIVFIPFQPTVVYRVAILTPAHNPISQLARAFSDLLKKEVESIIEG